jgi:hypothetical protein
MRLPPLHLLICWTCRVFSVVGHPGLFKSTRNRIAWRRDLVRCRRSVDRRAGDRPMSEPPQGRPGVAPLVGGGVQACRNMCGCALSSRRAALSIIRAQPAVAGGEPRSLTNTKGDVGASRCSRRRARSSSLWIGCVLGVPFLTRRMWSTAPSKSAWFQPKSQASGRCVGHRRYPCLWRLCIPQSSGTL